jgi:hypothetical protein
MVFCIQAERASSTSPLNEGVVQFCLNHQHDRAPATFAYVIDFIGLKGGIGDKFWVRHFVQRQTEQLCIQQATILEKN